MGRNCELYDAEYAANSAISSVVLTTPTPPINPPLMRSNRGTPPGLTAVGSLSLVSFFPVMMPGPKEPSIANEGFNACPGRKLVLRVQPRFVFSIPYRSALAVPATPGGK